MPPAARRAAAALSDPRRAVLAAALLAIIAICLDVLSDPDVWWHLRLGDWILDNRAIPRGELFSYTAQGNPFTAHEWLMDSLFALLNRATGLLGVALFAAAISWSGFLALALLLRRRGIGPVATAVTVLLAAKAAQPVLGTRPQVATFALTAWTLLIVDGHLRGGSRRVWLLIPLTLLWANLHAGFVTGIGVMAASVAAEEISARLGRDAAPPPARHRLALVTLLSAAVACVNPAGPSLYRFAVVVSATERQKAIVEWQPPNFTDPGLWTLLVAIVVVAGGIVLLRPRLRDWGLALAGAALALYAVRNTAVGLALMGPVLGTALSALLPRIRWRAGRGDRDRVLAPVLVVAGALVAAVSITRAAGDAAGSATAYPGCTAGILERAPSPQRVFASYGTAGYLIYRDWPQVRVYEYGESISLGSQVFADYVTIVGGGGAATSLLDGSGTTAVLIEPSGLDRTLRSDPGWQLVAADGGKDLFVRAGEPWAADAHC